MSDDGDDRERRGRRLDSVIPEMLKRALEAGVERAPDNLKHFVSELRVPKEIVQLIIAQIDETKNGLFRVVAKEVREFLEHTNFTGELEKLLTTVQFEVNTTIRFRPNDGKTAAAQPENSDEKSETPPSAPGTLPKPEVKSSVSMHRAPERRRRGSRQSDG